MNYWLELAFAVVVFAVGLRLSAFFSGSETGFYRLSLPRLSIDARAGDRPAQRLLWFTKRPAYFVATCLIGNNVANYLTTAAIGWVLVLLLGKVSESQEVIATLVMSPIIFQFGELLPKSIYYLSPLGRLRRDSGWFQFVYFAFFPITWPLVLLTRVLETLTGQAHRPTEILLGRNRLVQLMQHGRREGILTDLQSRLANGLLQLAPQNVVSSMIPSARVLGVSAVSTREETLQFARKFGVSAVPVHHSEQESGWYGCAYVAEMLVSNDEQLQVHTMPEVSHRASKLEALYKLQVADATYGAVVRDEVVIGIVSRNGLVEQLHRPDLMTASRAPRGRLAVDALD